MRRSSYVPMVAETTVCMTCARAYENLSQHVLAQADWAFEQSRLHARRSPGSLWCIRLVRVCHATRLCHARGAAQQNHALRRIPDFQTIISFGVISVCISVNMRGGVMSVNMRGASRVKCLHIYECKAAHAIIVLNFSNQICFIFSCFSNHLSFL